MTVKTEYQIIFRCIECEKKGRASTCESFSEAWEHVFDTYRQGAMHYLSTEIVLKGKEK